MYAILVVVHSVVRWLLVAAAVGAVVATRRGRAAGAPWTPGGRRALLLVVMAADVQLLLGLALWLGVSPLGLAGGGSSYWKALHPALGVAVVALAHVGSVRARRAPEGEARWRIAGRFAALVLVATLLSVPWPFLAAGRPLWPF